MTQPYFLFPTGESHCNADPKEFDGALPHCFAQKRIYIPYKRDISINDWLMQVVLAAHATNDPEQDVWMPYLPYSRQDRPMPHQPFSLKVIAGLLNDMPCRRIITLDVHSDVAFACIPKLVSVGLEDIWINLELLSTYAGLMNRLAETTLVIPDAGAFKKLNKLSSWFNNVAVGMKERDTTTGHLTLKGLYGDVKDRHCLIMDDIADGGYTFIQLANALYNQGAESVKLAVTHGIFTKGTKVLYAAGIRHIFTTDSFVQLDASVYVQKTESIIRNFKE